MAAIPEEKLNPFQKEQLRLIQDSVHGYMKHANECARGEGILLPAITLRFSNITRDEAVAELSARRERSCRMALYENGSFQPEGGRGPVVGKLSSFQSEQLGRINDCMPRILERLNLVTRGFGILVPVDGMTFKDLVLEEALKRFGQVSRDGTYCHVLCCCQSGYNCCDNC